MNRVIDVRSIDVRDEVRKFASSKPVQAAAGAGVVASERLRDLPNRLGELQNRLGDLPNRLGDLPNRVGELPNRVGELQNRLAGLHLETAVVNLPARATEYVLTARSKAMDEYERLAKRGRKALREHGALPGTSHAHSKAHEANGRATTSGRTTRPTTRSTRTTK